MKECLGSRQENGLARKSEGKQSKSFLLLCRLSPENVTQIDSGSTELKWSNKKALHRCSNKKTLHRCAQLLWL